MEKNKFFILFTLIILVSGIFYISAGIITADINDKIAIEFCKASNLEFNKLTNDCSSTIKEIMITEVDFTKLPKEVKIPDWKDTTLKIYRIDYSKDSKSSKPLFVISN